MFSYNAFLRVPFFVRGIRRSGVIGLLAGSRGKAADPRSRQSEEVVELIGRATRKKTRDG